MARAKARSDITYDAVVLDDLSDQQVTAAVVKVLSDKKHASLLRSALKLAASPQRKAASPQRKAAASPQRKAAASPQRKAASPQRKAASPQRKATTRRKT